MEVNTAIPELSNISSNKSKSSNCKNIIYNYKIPSRWNYMQKSRYT